MTDEPEFPGGGTPDGKGIVWSKLALVWGVGLLVRVVVFIGAFVSMWAFGYSVHGVAHVMMYFVFVPSSVICALVAGWMYPRQPLLAAAVPLLIPPDYGAPVGLLVVVAMRLARTETARGFVTIGAVVLMMALWWLPLLLIQQH